MVIQTKYNDKNKFELLDFEKILGECKRCSILVLGFAYSLFNEINCLFRSTGLYAEMIMQNDLSEMHGRLMNYPFPSQKFLQQYLQVRCYLK